MLSLPGMVAPRQGVPWSCRLQGLQVELFPLGHAFAVPALHVAHANADITHPFRFGPVVKNGETSGGQADRSPDVS